eukprot:6458742-Amphidinium_carterae.2
MEEFAMFLFELCSIWCGPSVSLLARGAHTLGLRPISDVTRLPKSFYDLVAAQCWHEDPKVQLTAEERLKRWMMANATPESIERATSQAQKQYSLLQSDTLVHTPRVSIAEQGPSALYR